MRAREPSVWLGPALGGVPLVVVRDTSGSLSGGLTDGTRTLSTGNCERGEHHPARGSGLQNGKSALPASDFDPFLVGDLRTKHFIRPLRKRMTETVSRRHFGKCALAHIVSEKDSIEPVSLAAY
jgi:hypothetical protein